MGAAAVLATPAAAPDNMKDSKNPSFLSAMVNFKSLKWNPNESRNYIVVCKHQFLLTFIEHKYWDWYWEPQISLQYEQENKLYIFIVWWQFYNILAFKAIWRATQKSRADLSQPVLISLKCYLRYVVPLLEPIVEHCSFIFSNVHWIANVHRTPLPSDHFNFPQMPGYLGDLLVTLHTIYRV